MRKIRNLDSGQLQRPVAHSGIEGGMGLATFQQIEKLVAQGLIESKDYSGARQELQRLLGRSEKLGLRLEDARIHYLLGTTMVRSGNSSEASAQFAEAGRLLDEISKEQGSEHLQDRYDLKPIYAEIKKTTH